jgi:hypothetical protein
MSFLVATLVLIAWIWWPLVRDYAALMDRSRSIWSQIDWLLIGIFAAMSLLIMTRANLRRDGWIVLVGLGGGLAIEGWGTRTQLWSYFTHERPPLWILPAWPIASLSIDRLVRLLDRVAPAARGKADTLSYAVVFVPFLVLMTRFVWPTLGAPLTLAALATCALLILCPGDRRLMLLTFAAGAGLGYFLERWGTTRECWTYYTRETPPAFAVLAHGMAAVAFWRVGGLLKGAAAGLERRARVPSWGLPRGVARARSLQD